MKFDNFLRMIKRCGRLFVTTSISVIARCFPIKKDTIVFASYPDFSDNAWAVYNYLKKNRKNLRLLWIVKQNNIPKEIEEKSILKYQGLKKIYTIWTINRAAFVLYTHGINSPVIRSKKQKIIFLNHAGGAIKNEKREFRAIQSCHKPYDYALCRGKDSVIPIAKWQCCDPKLVLPLGMARDDIFCKNIGPGYMNPFYNEHSRRVIVWMPTFRKSINPKLCETNSATPTGLPLMEKEEDVFALDKFLRDNDIQLLIKIHPMQEENDLFKKEFSNITIITYKDLIQANKQTYEIIGYSEALITDYSSVYYDYLLTNKPIGFILDDYEKYEHDRGFVFDNPKEIMAGHHIYEKKQLKNFFMDIINGNDQYKDKRLQMKNKFVGENPESTSKRIIEYFNI